MTAYAIMRCKKLAKAGNVAASLKHAYRESETFNADPGRTPDNEHWAAKSTDEAMGKIRELLPEKRRKDAVLAVEYMLTASPDWWKSASQEQQAAFFNQAHKWLVEKYGADRIVTASIHRDETSPHMTAFVVPLTKDGRLSAKDFIGNKAQMVKDQTTFAGAVADLGLKRGIEGSKAKHTRIQAFYEALERPPVAPITIDPQDVKPRKSKPSGLAGKLGLTVLVESPEHVAERLTEDVRQRYAPALQVASGAVQMRQKAIEMEKTALDLRERAKPFVEALAPLNVEMRAKVVAAVKEAGQKALAEQRQAMLQKQSMRHKARGKDLGR